MAANQLQPTGAMADLNPPQVPAPGTETSAAVGRLRLRVHKLTEIKALQANAVTNTEVGLAEVATARAANNLGGAPNWFGPAVAAAVGPAVAAAVGPAVAAAVGPAVAAAVANQLMDLKNEMRTRYNRTALGDPTAPLETLYRVAAAPHLPPAALNFPTTTTDFILLSAVGPARGPNNTTIDAILNFYGVLDPVTNGPFPAASVLALGAAGDAELVRKHAILRRFITDL